MPMLEPPTTKAAGKIFVSYRRDDTSGYAGRLAADLGRALGAERIFFDLHIGAGNDFIDELGQVIAGCEVVLVLIGPRWLTAADAEGRRRLDDPGDFLHQEVAISLRRGTRIIPLLFRGARVPATSDLPEPLRGLVRHQALEITDDRWDYDLARLLRALAPAGLPRRRPVYARRQFLLAAGAGAGGVLAVGGAALLGPGIRRKRSTEQSTRPDTVAGSAGAGRGSAGAIRGRVINFWRRPVAQARVTVGAQSAITDGDGVFSLPAVDATYTLRVDGPEVPTWVYQGLSRRDPTVQVSGGARQAGRLSWRAVNLPQGRAAEDKMALAAAFVGRDISWSRGEVPLPIGSYPINWRGPVETPGVAHAILWARGVDRYTPAAFLAHDAQPVVLGGAPTTVQFDLAARRPIETRTLSCAVTGGPAIRRWWLQLPDGAAVPLGVPDAEAERTSWLVPALPGATILVAAHSGLHGGPSAGRYVLAHAETPAAGGGDVTLTLPPAPRLDSPATGATGVGGSTPLRWWSVRPSVFVLRIGTMGMGTVVSVVTAGGDVRLDAAAAVDSLLATGETYWWSVETHGSLVSVDDFCRAPGGVFDRFTADGDPTGPAGTTREYARSELRRFTWGSPKLAGQ